ncbi:MAG: alginate export family protein [Candidatus Omnitrophica bacterium]|nr:alginate export family protein [Candidatus Omnitrophota bacterium]
MRLLKGLCVLVLAIGLTSMVYAETQSVKISGDLTIRSIFRGDYDLDRNHAEAVSTRTGNQSDWETYFMTTTELQIDADLTDNVSAVIRLYNQRDWNVACKSICSGTALAGRGGYTATDDEFDIGVDLAYLELKEFLYSPLTLRIGRQDIWFGKGFVVGVNQLDPQGTINADEYTTSNAFDAVRATLDYDPWTIDLIAAKIWENAIQASDDEDLYGVNVGYIFDVYNAEAEAYWFNKRDDSTENWNIKQGNIIQTMGLRGSFDPIENWTVAAESAYQWGHYVGTRDQTEKRDRNAWALDVSAECRHFQELYAWKPKIGVEYIYYSGHKNINDEEIYLNNPKYASGTYTGWDRMYRGKFDSAIRDYYGIYYASNQDSNNYRSYSYYGYPDAADQNQHQIIVAGSVQPTDSLTVDLRYFNFWQQYKTSHYDVCYVAGHGKLVKDKGYLGSEIDLELTWDYTEDVSFGFLSAWFFPGGHYYDQSDDVATDVVGSVKLSF